MAIKKGNKRYSGYSAAVVRDYVSETDRIHILPTSVEHKNKWVDNKPTKEIEFYNYEFYINGVGSLEIKFPKELKGIQPYSEVKIHGFVAAETSSGVYFKGDDVEVVQQWELVQV